MPKSVINWYCIWLLLLVRLDFHIVLLASERRFRCTKKHSIWIQYAKVTEDQSLALKVFLPHRDIIGFGDVQSEDGGLRTGATWGCLPYMDCIQM